MKNKDKLISCYISLKDYYNAALLCEKDRDIDKAISFFRDFAQISHENRKVLIEEAEKYATKRSKLKSAIRFSALSMYDRSAPIFLEKRHYKIALKEFRAIKTHERAAACCLRLNDCYNAALEYEKSNRTDKWDMVAKT